MPGAFADPLVDREVADAEEAGRRARELATVGEPPS
jgi:hypothetical protein